MIRGQTYLGNCRPGKAGDPIIIKPGGGGTTDGCDVNGFCRSELEKRKQSWKSSLKVFKLLKDQFHHWRSVSKPLKVHFYHWRSLKYWRFLNYWRSVFITEGLLTNLWWWSGWDNLPPFPKDFCLWWDCDDWESPPFLILAAALAILANSFWSLDFLGPRSCCTAKRIR